LCSELQGLVLEELQWQELVSVSSSSCAEGATVSSTAYYDIVCIFVILWLKRGREVDADFATVKRNKGRSEDRSRIRLKML